MKRAVITGLGALTPIGNNVPDFWNALINGVSGAAPITRFDTSKYKTRFACEVKNFDPLTVLDKAEVRKNDLFSLFALAAVDEAIKDARLDFDTLDRTRIGVIWGSGQGGMTTFEEQLHEFHKGDGTPRFNPYLIPKMITNIAAGVISIKYNLQGINYGTVSACASSNTAMVDALNYIRWGKANMVITGGSEAPLSPGPFGGFSAMKAMSTRNDDCATASRPFDKDRDGFVMGEGAGALVIEELEHALQRGATIYAELAGGAMTGDAYHLSATHPEGEGAYRAMKLALEDAGLTINDVQYINTHATSTPVGDLSEITAVTRLFGESAPNVKISATKSMTGHLLGGAGAVEGIASVLAIKNGIIPPTINTTELDPKIPAGLGIVTGKAVHHTVNVAMSNTFGFGGHNAIAVFKRYEP